MERILGKTVAMCWCMCCVKEVCFILSFVIQAELINKKRTVACYIMHLLIICDARICYDCYDAGILAVCEWDQSSEYIS